MKKFTLLFSLVMMNLTMMAATHSLGSVAQLNTLSAATTDSVTFTCPLVALTQAGKYLLLTDGTDNALVYGYATGINSACQNGDTITGLTALYCMYNNQLELKNARFTVGGHGPSVAPAELDHVGADNLLAYGKLTGVTASYGSNQRKLTFYKDNSTIVGYNAANITLAENISSTLNYEGFVMLSTSTYQFIPTSWSGEVEEVTYTPVASIAEFNALPDGSNFEFTTDVTVSFVYRIQYNCATLFQDANGDGGQIYNVRHSLEEPYLTNYEMGDIIPGGWKGVKIDYNGTPEITPVDGFLPSTGHGTINVNERTFASLTAADVNNVVLIRNVQLVNTGEYSAKDQEKHRNATDGTVDVFDLYDTYHSNEANTGYVLFPTVDGTYDMVGIAAIYKGNMDVHPISFNGQLPNGVLNISAEQAAKLIENGQLIIVRDGIRYNALGVVME